MESMPTNETVPTVSDAEPVRRRGDRRVNDVIVNDDRRKGDRRDIPGFSALIRTLFRRGSDTKS